MVVFTRPGDGEFHRNRVRFTMLHTPLLADLAADLPQPVRLQRLVSHLRTGFGCGAVALLQLEAEHLRPVAVDGLVPETLGRRFAVGQHPRLAAILARGEVTCFHHDSQLPDPYDGLLDTLVGEPLPVHDCMGVSLQMDGQPWGVLTLDALQTGTFGEAARAELADCKVLVEAAVRISRLEREVQALRSAPHTRGAEDERTTRAGEGDMEIVGQSEPLLRLLHELEVVAGSDLPVLLLGETGVGKELFARLLHRQSPRAARPLVHVNCAALPESLAESELFGHVRGAFSGAVTDRPGRFEAAEGGTLFLDEVGDIPLPMQVKLLRLLETGTYRRVGGVDTLRADFRLVAATHRDLKEMVRQERFRRDLYYRLNTFPIHTPSLAERREDIPLLAASLLERVDHRPGRHFSAEALAWLAGRNWEGNIRELRNLIERATLMSDGEEISAAKLAEVADDGGESKALAEGVGGGAADSFRVPGPLPLAQLEQRYLTWLMARPGADVRTLAPALGVSERTLYRKLRR